MRDRLLERRHSLQLSALLDDLQYRLDSARVGTLSSPLMLTSQMTSLKAQHMKIYALTAKPLWEFFESDLATGAILSGTGERVSGGEQ